MPNLRSAFLCAFIFLSLISCNYKHADERSASLPADATSALPLEESANMFDIGALHTKFITSATQHFFVSAKNPSKIETKAGLKLQIDPSTLEREDGQLFNGNLDVSILELTNVNDLFKSNVGTMSNGKLLASGGSYYIDIHNAGSDVRIKKGKSIEASFPVLKNENMELFYGERDANRNMNWEPANVVFNKQYETINFTNTGWGDLRPQVQEEIAAKVFKSLDETVYYYNKRMTLQQMVDTINKNDTKVLLKTVSYWPKDLPKDKKLDTNYLTKIYGPYQQYILKVCKDIENQEEKSKETIANWKPTTLAGQLLKNYAPVSITSLGWINCDKFYTVPENTETPIEIPYAFNNSRIQYFLLYKKFNGLMTGSAVVDTEGKFILSGLPVGEAVKLIAFTKKDGVVYQSVEDFNIKKDRSLAIEFKKISNLELMNIFGPNVKI
ncbi:MAG: hypothetical protein JST81_08260 [Bacteroidetes bacterium]|nr:hypothetical protein [Bacteroidota bacterium]